MNVDQNVAMAYPAEPEFTFAEMLLRRYERYLLDDQKLPQEQVAAIMQSLEGYRKFASSYSSTVRPFRIRPTFGNYAVAMTNGDEFVISAHYKEGSAAAPPVGYVPDAANNIAANQGAVPISGINFDRVKVVDYRNQRYSPTQVVDKRVTTKAAPPAHDLLNR